MLKVSDRALDALTILKQHQPLTARRFGEKFWPGHEMHSVVSQNGSKGAVVGKRGWLMAGRYLGRLRKKGWVERRETHVLGRKGLQGVYFLTPEGADVLNDLG